MNLFLNELEKDNFKILCQPNKEKEFLRAEEFFCKEKIFQQREKNNKLYSKEKLQKKQVKYFSSLDFFLRDGIGVYPHGVRSRSLSVELPDLYRSGGAYGPYLCGLFVH